MGENIDLMLSQLRDDIVTLSHSVLGLQRTSADGNSLLVAELHSLNRLVGQFLAVELHRAGPFPGPMTQAEIERVLAFNPDADRPRTGA